VTLFAPEHPRSFTIRRGRGVVLVAAAIIVCGIVGAFASRPKAAAVVAGVAVVPALSALGTRRLLSLLVAGMYFTRFRVELVGFSFLPEHLLVLVVLVAAVEEGQVRRLGRALRSRTVRFMGLFVIWGAVVSLLQAPRPGRSLAIVGWLALSWLILLTLVALSVGSAWIQRQLFGWAVVASVTSLLVYFSARVTGSSFGLQRVAGEVGQALYGTAFEANILGSTLAVAAFIGLTASAAVIPRKARWIGLPPIALAMALSLTRGAFVGLALGLAVWAALSPRLAWRRLVPLVVLVGTLWLAVSTVEPSTVALLNDRVAHGVDFGTGTGRGRVDGWLTAIDDIRGLPLVIGLGVNSFGQRHNEPTLPNTNTPANLANVLLQIVYDTGLLGVAILSVAFAASIRRPTSSLRRASGLLALVVAASMATSTFWFGSTWALVALAVLSSPRHRRLTRDGGDLGDAVSLRSA